MPFGRSLRGKPVSDITGDVNDDQTGSKYTSISTKPSNIIPANERDTSKDPSTREGILPNSSDTYQHHQTLQSGGTDVGELTPLGKRYLAAKQNGSRGGNVDAATLERLKVHYVEEEQPDGTVKRRPETAIERSHRVFKEHKQRMEEEKKAKKEKYGKMYYAYAAWNTLGSSILASASNTHAGGAS